MNEPDQQLSRPVYTILGFVNKSLWEMGVKCGLHTTATSERQAVYVRTDLPAEPDRYAQLVTLLEPVMRSAQPLIRKAIQDAITKTAQ